MKPGCGAFVVLHLELAHLRWWSREGGAWASQFLSNSSGQVSSEPKCWRDPGRGSPVDAAELAKLGNSSGILPIQAPAARHQLCARRSLWMAASCVRSPGPPQVFLASVNQASAVRFSTDVRQEKCQDILALVPLLWASPVPTANLKLSWQTAATLCLLTFPPEHRAPPK